MAPNDPLARAVGDAALEALGAQPIGVGAKGFPAGSERVLIRDVGAQGWNALAGDFLLPLMVLHEDALAHNLALMAEFCRSHAVSLAPHGKTTMSPQLVRRQIDSGAWGVTAATVSQARIFRSFGVERIVIASQVVEPAGLRWLVGELERDPAFEVFVLVDSRRAVAIANAALHDVRGTRLRALVELGLPGGRTGCRSLDEAVEVAEAVAASPVFDLAGVEAFEGIVEGVDPGALARVDALLDDVATLVHRLDAAAAFAGRDDVIVSAGGSIFFDRVIERFAGLEASRPLRVVLRGGCYLTHDSGMYEAASALAGRSGGGPRLRAAIEVWGAVLSRPEPDLAIVGLGKRDVSFDIDLPLPLRVLVDGELRDLAPGPEVFALNDQHAYLRLDRETPLEVGDLVGFGVSHPCTTFDRWRLIPVVDRSYAVIDAVATYF